jgi:hypothetical protein
VTPEELKAYVKRATVSMQELADVFTEMARAFGILGEDMKIEPEEISEVNRKLAAFRERYPNLPVDRDSITRTDSTPELDYDGDPILYDDDDSEDRELPRLDKLLREPSKVRNKLNDPALANFWSNPKG